MLVTVAILPDFKPLSRPSKSDTINPLGLDPSGFAVTVVGKYDPTIL